MQVVRSGYARAYAGRTPYAAMFNEAAARFEKTFLGVDYDPSTDIIPVNACGHGYEFFYYCLANPGDVFISENPSHANGFGRQGWLVWGIETKLFPLIEEENWEPDLDALYEIPIRKDRNNVFILVNPNNPTGVAHSEKTLKAYADWAAENEIIIITDEMYVSMILDPDVKCPTMAAVARDVPVIKLNSFSKYFMSPGWGVGYMAIQDPTGKVKEILRTGARHGRFRRASTPMMGAAALGMLKYCEEYKSSIYLEPLREEGRNMSALYWSNKMMERCKENRDFIDKRVNEIDGLSQVRPNATLYSLVKIEDVPKVWKTDGDFLIQMAKEENVLLLPARQYGDQALNHFRTINYMPKEFYEELFNRVESFIKRARA
jgi:aspartate/methionine/tyrosine aminotransferase